MSGINDILNRHKAFWNMADVPKPLLRFSQYTSRYGQPQSPMSMPLADGIEISEDVFYLEPEMLAPEKFAPKNERPSAIPATSGDVFPVRSAFTKIPWMEAIVGCPIRVSLQSHSMWSEPVLGEDWYRNFQSLKPHEGWRNKLLESIEFLSANASNSYQVVNTLMRGPSDMVDAFIGEANLCMGIYQHPDEIHELMDICAKIFIDTAKEQLKRISPFQDGYCNLFGIWAPGNSIRTQDDASALVSPEHYSEFMLPPQEQIASEFDYSTIHLHSNSLHTADSVINSSIGAVQVSMDPQPYGPTVIELLPTFAKMQEKKPILIEGPMMQAEFDELLETLSSNGLYVWAMIESEEDRDTRKR